MGSSTFEEGRAIDVTDEAHVREMKTLLSQLGLSIEVRDSLDGPISQSIYLWPLFRELRKRGYPYSFLKG